MLIVTIKVQLPPERRARGPGNGDQGEPDSIITSNSIITTNLITTNSIITIDYYYYYY